MITADAAYRNHDPRLLVEALHACPSLAEVGGREALAKQLLQSLLVETLRVRAGVA